jgi:hypothetical protein
MWPSEVNLEVLCETVYRTSLSGWSANSENKIN